MLQAAMLVSQRISICRLFPYHSSSELIAGCRANVEEQLGAYRAVVVFVSHWDQSRV